MYKQTKTLNMTKKPTSKDWHAADIIAAVRKTGTSLQKLSRLHGYASSTIQQAAHRPYPKCERIIADHLGLKPETIWPSRYNADGTPKSGRGERGIGRHSTNLIANSKSSIYAKKVFIHKCSTIEKVSNVKDNFEIKQAVAA